MDLDKLKDLVSQGYLRAQAHPYLPYTIYNYTEKTNYEDAWNELTLACRGLILEDDGAVVARPFRKFFNHGQAGAPSIALDEFVTVTDKMDGSLGILYPTTNGYAIASRGSFTSDQAEHATKVWKQRYAPHWVPEPGLTYLFEIVYPANRIVVDYGDMDDLVLLGAVDTATGRSVALGTLDWPGPAAEVFPYATFADALAAPDRPGAEGMVIHLPDSDERVKLKQEDYVRMHKIVTGLNARSVWEALAAGIDLDMFVAGLPDEFHAWAANVGRQLARAVADAEYDAIVEYQGVLAEVGEDFARKDFALAAKRRGNPTLLFALLDGKNLGPQLWRGARPEPGWAPTARSFSEDNA